MTQRKKSARTTTAANGHVRIIGGRWRGRKLPVVSGEGLRPTTDRIKETLFNWLQFELADARVVDLFAGSGSLGFEALSRGAKTCQFVETWSPAVKQLGHNIATLSAPAQVDTQGALAFLANCPAQSIDLLLLDPPFRKGWLEQVMPLIEAHDVLAPNAWVYAEHGTDEQPRSWPTGWRLHREKTAGQVCYRLFQYQP